MSTGREDIAQLDDGPHEVLFSCDCRSLFHVARLTVFERDPTVTHECYLTIRLQRPGSFWRRLARAFRFVFKPAGFYGEYEEFLIDEPTARRLVDGFTVFLNAPVRERTP